MSAEQKKMKNETLSFSCLVHFSQVSAAVCVANLVHDVNSAQAKDLTTHSYVCPNFLVKCQVPAWRECLVNVILGDNCCFMVQLQELGL